MWIDEIQDDQVLRTWLKHCPGLKLVSKLDGEIVWANYAFCEWSQYTLNELRSMTWMELSVPDKNLKADIDEAQNLDAYNPSYAIKKQYSPKGLKPEWGVLHVMRYPLTGPIEVCLCTWEPLKNGTATAFALAMEKSEEIHKRLNAMAADIEIRKARSTAERLWDSFGEWALENPKLALVVLLILLALNPAPIIITWVTRLGWLPAQPVQLEIRDNKTGQAAPATEQQINDIRSYAHAHQIADLAAVKVIEITTPEGFRVGWSTDAGWGRTLPNFIGRGNPSGDRIGCSPVTAAGADRGISDLHGRTF